MKPYTIEEINELQSAAVVMQDIAQGICNIDGTEPVTDAIGACCDRIDGIIDRNLQSCKPERLKIS